MKRLLHLLALGSLAAHFGVRANDIEPTKEKYTAIHRGTAPIVVDGDLTEWAGVPVLADPKFAIPKGSGPGATKAGDCTQCVNDVANPNYVLWEPLGGTWSGPDDQTSAVEVVWDDQNVYFAFTVTDDNHENTANSAWNGDSVQLMIADASRSSQVALYNYALGGTDDALGDVIVNHEAGPAANTDCACETTAVVKRDSVKKKTYYEISLPKAALGLANLTAGTQFGLGMAINDGDEPESQHGQKGWGGLGAHSIVYGKHPSETALVTLSGDLPSTDKIFYSAVNPTFTGITFRVNDKGAAVLNPASVKLTVNGQTVTPTASPKSGDATDFKYTPAAPFTAGSTVTYTIQAADAKGVAVSVDGTFLVPSYALLTAAEKVTADTSKPGFHWRVHQNNAFTANDNVRPLQQLAGLLGKNFADPAAQGVAIAAGTPEATENLPIDFDIDTVINMSQTGGDANGEFPDDGQMPGIPGTGDAGQTDGIAGEITTYVELPVGLQTFIVNSDDGFRTTAGIVNDVFKAKFAGEFSGGRGAADTSYQIYVQDAGIYGLRTVWQEGGGGANIEWKYVKSDGTHVLINDTANGGPKAYRAITGAATTVSSVTPGIDASAADVDTAIGATIQEGAAAVDVSSVKLTLDGAPLAASATKSGNLISIKFQPASILLPRSQHTATLTYSAGGQSRTETWKFTAANTGILTPDMKVTNVDTSKPGFHWRVHQNNAFTALDGSRMLKQIAGLLGPNLADPAAQGVAIAPGVPESSPNLPIDFDIDTVINLDQAGGGNGEFTPDDQMPGIPGTGDAGQTDGIAGEITTYVQLPAGKVTMIVNSDDDFRATAGSFNDILDAKFLGSFTGGRGAADTSYSFFVQEAGIYPLKTVWAEGGGGANIEWKYVKPDGTHALINDSANGGPKAYRALAGGATDTRPYVASVNPGVDQNPTIPNERLTVLIQEPGATQVDTASLKLALDGTDVASTATRSGKLVTVTAKDTPVMSAGVHTGKVTYSVGGTSKSGEWTFTVRPFNAATPLAVDKLHSYPGVLLGNAVYTADAGGHSGKAGDRAIDLGQGGNASVVVTDGSFVNATTADNKMTFATWVKKYDIANSSVFWADSPSSPSGQRGFQAHTPWSDNNVYFDTAGCCAGGDTRISKSITEFGPYQAVGDNTWWNTWHHFVFAKDGDHKTIYIDGELFHEGDNVTPLPTDFARIWIGAEGGGPTFGTGNFMHALVDDFAIYGTALGQADVTKLFTGTAPDALAATTKPLAYWNFDTPSGGGGNTGGDQPQFTSVTRNADGSITVVWTGGGALEATPTLTNPTWSAVTGAASPYKFTPNANQKTLFARIKK
jgi:hypothetical protein